MLAMRSADTVQTVMPRAITPEQRRALAERVNYYRDLGIHDFYRRAGD